MPFLYSRIMIMHFFLINSRSETSISPMTISVGKVVYYPPTCPHMSVPMYNVHVFLLICKVVTGEPECCQLLIQIKVKSLRIKD